MNSNDARELMHEWVKSESLRKHCESVAASMGYLAEKFMNEIASLARNDKLSVNTENELLDVDTWIAVGLLHDFDYEKYPSLEDHPFKGVEYLRSIDVDERICRAILSHAEYSAVKRESLMEKALFACDELSGFVTACVLVRPDKDINSLEVKSVKKKLKDKAFARQVSREDIMQGANELEMELDELIGDVIEAQKKL